MKTVRLGFRLFDAGDGLYRVELSIDGTGAVTGTFEFDLRPDSRAGRVLRAVEQGRAHLEDLKDIGSQLWGGLLNGEVGRALARWRVAAAGQEPFVQFRLDLPPELESLPWEALYDEQQGGFLSSRPRVCVLREPSARLLRPKVAAAPLERLRTLVVIPEGSGLAVDHERQNLAEAVGQLTGAIELKPLGGRVVPDTLQEALARERIDLFHYIGHGTVDEADHVRIRLHGDGAGEAWFDGQAFAAVFEESPVRLAVLNCCLGAYPSHRLSLSGLGPYLLQRGVPAVVSMRYEIPDIEAIRFSKLFYRHLLDPRSFGRVDIAVARARQSLFLNLRDGAARAFITPVLHLATGEEPLFVLSTAAAPAPRVPVAEREAVGERPPLPADLAEALCEGRLIPVLGPDLLAAGATRGQPCPLDPRRLIFDLAQKSEYPRPEDLALVEKENPWLAGLLLAMVCQHFVRGGQRFRRFELIRLLQEAYEQSQRDVPALLLDLAGWPVPGIVCTYFDGLIDDALAREDKTPRSLTVSSAADEPGGDLVVVHLRGKPTEPDSLVLTEEENEQLSDRLTSLPAALIHLLHDRVGRSLLFLGVSPRDPVVRRLGRQLLGGAGSQNRGPAFFVCRRRDAVEEAYWRPVEGLVWVEADPGELVRSLSALLPRGER